LNPDCFMCLAVPGRAIEVLDDDPDLRWGWVEFAGLRRQVALACVPDAGPGDYVLVHARMALSRVDEVEARALLAMIEELGDDERGADAPPG
jgi:hydrogenase expression/formation protein HypC